MQNDSKNTHAGISVATHAWEKFLKKQGNPQSPELVVTHQVGKAHQQEIEKAFLTTLRLASPLMNLLGIGSVSLPLLTL